MVRGRLPLISPAELCEIRWLPKEVDVPPCSNGFHLWLNSHVATTASGHVSMDSRSLILTNIPRFDKASTVP